MRVESHLSKVPFMATDASTKNVIELFTGVIVKTGASARVTDGSKAETKKQKIVDSFRMADNFTYPRFIVNRKLHLFLEHSGTGIPPGIHRAVYPKSLVAIDF